MPVFVSSLALSRNRMSIWVYPHCLQDPRAVADAVNASNCVFCKTRLVVPQHDSDFREDSGHGKLSTGVGTSRWVHFCPTCGWWTIREEVTYKKFLKITRVKYGAAATLQELDISDQSLPLNEIRSYLAARYDARFKVHPRRFEEVVASVYADLGYQTVVTAYSGDDGIDVILEGPQKTRTGVQVKRTKNAITAEQIRSLAGALYLKGITRGIFVTTSSFQRGATRTATLAALRGIPVELIDAPRFYAALGISQRNLYATSSDPAAPFAAVELVELDT